MADNNFSLSDYYELKKANLLTDEGIRDRISLEPLDLVFWYDHIAELADVRSEIDVGRDDDGNPLVQHKRHDGVVFQEGTPVNAEHLGKMEWNDLINHMRVLKLEEAVKALQIQVATLLGQNNNNMPFNSFVASATEFNVGLKGIKGRYDAVNGRWVNG